MPNTDPYQRWLDLRDRWRTEEGESLKPSDEIAAALRVSTVAMLRAVAKGDASLPGDVAFELADAIEALEAGQDATYLLPEKLKLAFRKQPRVHPFLEDLRRDAVNYLQLVESGDLSDGRPFHTVAQIYGVERRTVHRWRRKFTDLEKPLSQPTLVKAIFRASGKQYKKQFKRLVRKSE
jgi:hypothetical protein